MAKIKSLVKVISISSLVTFFVGACIAQEQANAKAQVFNDQIFLGNVEITNDLIVDGNEIILGNLVVNGIITAVGGIIDLNPSIRDVKTDIKEIDTKESLTKINSLVPKTFRYIPEWSKDLAAQPYLRRGFIAQEFKEVFPEFVYSIPDQKVKGKVFSNLYGLQSEKLVTDLVGAVKELTKKIEGLEAQVKELQKNK